jgi:enoyl-[acyl-carrier protein] reductase/trans-2-enoyl-CoA reductase (NAD+)
MIVEPKIRHNMCVTAHPAGCALQVREQIGYVRARGPIGGGPAGGTAEKVLVVGSTNGYGLAARVCAAFGCGASTAGVGFEKPGTGTRTGTVGWYNDKAFLAEAAASDLPAWSVNGDAFSKEVKVRTLDIVGRELGGVDLFVYSIASPRRSDPETGALYSTSIKPVGKRFEAMTLDFQTGRLTEVAAEPATEEEVLQTVKVMGGEDWELWVRALEREGLLGPSFTTVAFSYVGPRLTAPIYRDGTIGKAKEHLEATAKRLDSELRVRGGRALISVNKALVTRASAVIPAVPLYIALLYRVMKAKGIHEGCIDQMDRLFRDYLYSPRPGPLDRGGRIRLDDGEMRPDVQREVEALWKEAEARGPARLSGNGKFQEEIARFENEISDFRTEFLRHHGFEMEGIDYGADVET